MQGLKADEARIERLMRESLMLVTALAPEIGYDNATTVAKTAHKNGTTLREEAVRLGFVDEATFDRIVRPEKMVGALLTEECLNARNRQSEQGPQGDATRKQEAASR